MFEKVLDFIYPVRCMACGHIMTERRDFCEECSKTLHFLKRKEIYNINNRYNAATGVFHYTGAGKTLLYRYKFGAKTYLSKPISKYMAQVVKEEYGNIDFDVITFVPMTKWEKYERKFNQSELLAKSLSKRLNIECKSLLKKKKNTRRQHKSDIKEREKNLKNCFAVNKNTDVKGKMVLLVDDIKTTGATLNECSKVLRKAGAKAICCVTVAFT